MHDATVKWLSGIHTLVFRATGGRIGNRLVGNDMLLLTTRGRRSGHPHTVPLLFLSEGGRLVVVASYGGRPQHPEWYRNLLADPWARVTIDRRSHVVVATPMDAKERARWWPRIVAAYGDYATYQRRTDRAIPLVWLDPETSDDGGR